MIILKNSYYSSPYYGGYSDLEERLFASFRVEKKAIREAITRKYEQLAKEGKIRPEEIARKVSRELEEALNNLKYTRQNQFLDVAAQRAQASGKTPEELKKISMRNQNGYGLPISGVGGGVELKIGDHSIDKFRAEAALGKDTVRLLEDSGNMSRESVPLSRKEYHSLIRENSRLKYDPTGLSRKKFKEKGWPETIGYEGDGKVTKIYPVYDNGELVDLRYVNKRIYD